MVSVSSVRFVPLLATAIALSTIGLCIYLAKHNDHIPSWLNTPTISICANQGTERYIYIIGMLTVCVLFYVASIPFVRFLMSRAETSFQPAAKASFIVVCLAFLGLALQAIIPIQKNALDKMIEEDANNAKLSFWSYVHQTGAAAFFICTWIHMGLILYLFRMSPRLATFYSSCQWKFKVLCLIAPGIGLFVVMLKGSGSTTHQQLNAQGLSQLLMVLSALLFYGSYTYDLSMMEKAQQPGSLGADGGSIHEDGIELQIPGRSLMSHEHVGAEADEERAGLLSD